MHGERPPTSPLSPARAAALLLEALEAGGQGALLVRATSAPGAETGPLPRLLILREASGKVRAVGTLGDPDSDREAFERISTGLTEGGATPRGCELLELGASGSAPVRVHAEWHSPPATLVIVGAGHIARPLAEVGGILGFRVTVLDDRPEFATRERFPAAAEVRTMAMSDPFAGIPIHAGSHVILVTRGHRYDYECLLHLLQGATLPGYLGLIGSRRRIRATFAQLIAEQIPRDRIERIRAPLGLDIGAQTPAEIAVAIAAELVLLHRRGTGLPLRERERVLERFFPEEG